MEILANFDYFIALHLKNTELRIDFFMNCSLPVNVCEQKFLYSRADTCNSPSPQVSRVSVQVLTQRDSSCDTESSGRIRVSEKPAADIIKTRN